MKTSDFNFRVPERLIPLTPPELRGERREDARMVVLNRAEQRIEHDRFDHLGEYLRPGDVLVVNDTMMVHDQLRGWNRRGAFKLILFGHHADGWHAAVRPASRARRGLVIKFGCGELKAVLVKQTIDDLWLVRFEHDEIFDFYELLMEHGERNVPLYKPLRERMETYLNVYAREPGSLEIPSAGLHFTDELLRCLRRQGVKVVALTLHIGLTELQRYRHIAEEEVEDHRVGAEWYRVKASAARNQQRAAARRAHRGGRDERRSHARNRRHGDEGGCARARRRRVDRPLHLPRPPIQDG